jgi:branched-chain amino acid aminotransferase
MLPNNFVPPKPPEYIIFMNGKFLPQSQAVISVLDHGFMYGDGCFDAYCGKNGYIFMLEEHTDRLYRSIHALKLNVTMPKEDMNRNIVECVRLNGLLDFYIKVIVSRGASPEPVLDPRKCPEPMIVIYARQLMHERDPKKVNSGIRLKISAIRRIPHDCIEPKVKTCNYLNHVLPKFEVWEAGYDDALMLDTRGYVSEAAGYNIFAVTNGGLITPENNILEGITRRAVTSIAKELNLSVTEGLFTPYDFFTADEVFLTNTVSGVTPVTYLDGYTIGSGELGPVTGRIRDIYYHMLETGQGGTPVYPEAVAAAS